MDNFTLAVVIASILMCLAFLALFLLDKPPQPVPARQPAPPTGPTKPSGKRSA